MLAKKGGGVRGGRATVEAARGGWDWRRWSQGSKGETFDVVFSNAALHWVEDHAALLAKLAADAPTPGGQLAVQMPNNEDHASHATAGEVAARSRSRARAACGARRTVLPIEESRRASTPLGFRARRCAVAGVYLHELASSRSVDIVESGWKEERSC